MLAILLLFGILVSEVQCGYYFVTAPNVLRFDQDETVVVSVFGLNNAAVKVWLEHENKQFSVKNVLVKDEKHPENIFVRVTENDTVSTLTEEKTRKVKLCAEWNGQKQTREIILSYHSGYLIIQTDKPIYTPKEKVKIRTLALDESLKAVDGWQVGMDIVSPSNKTLGRKLIKGSPSGFYQNDFTLPPYPEIGLWSARAFYKGQFETESHALFEVREYVLPTFGVTIDVDVEYILPQTKHITVTVKAKYVYGKPVQGNARLTLRLKGEDKDTDYIIDLKKKQLENSPDVEGSATEFRLDVKKDILDSSLLRDKPFPNGKRLEVIATVYESATGNEEAASHDGTIFTESPFIFKFTKSKLNFRPGYKYYLKVELFYVNGKPAKDTDVEVSMFEDGVLKEEKAGVTNDDGRIIQIQSTAAKAKKISFKVSTSNNEFESDEFVVTAYPGKNQMQVEYVTTDNNLNMMRAFTNIKGNSYTGMFFVVVTRGKIVFIKYKDAANEASEETSDQLEELVSPDARLLVFYVDTETDVIVADSVKFEVEKKCRGDGLHLETDAQTVKPGSNGKLTVTGTPLMFVGLNIIDKALLLLNDKNVLKKKKMFETLQSHDLGCGEGSGKSGADVFKNSGLTVLTNAKVEEADLERQTDGCKRNTRKRRDADSCWFGVAETCCTEGYDFAVTLFELEEYPERMNSRRKCLPKALILAEENRLSIKCVMAFFKSCVDESEYMITEETKIVSKSLDDESEYLEDIAKLADNGIISKTRSDFRESWLFSVYNLDQQGQMQMQLKVPDSITEWRIQAIGITKDIGMCTADPVDFKAFRDFFIQLDLPYKAARLEHFNVKATIFNYGQPGDAAKTANVYLKGVDNLCYNSDPGKPSPRVQVKLPPNSAKTVSFPMIPLKDGLFPVTVSAIVTDLGIPEVDVIEKRLYVVNEGIEEKLTIVVCLDPLKQKEDCVNDKRVVSDIQASNDERHYEIDLTLPENSISQTGAATAYIRSNIITDIVNTIIEGVDSLFLKPAGCGEQTMIRLAPTVYALSYLKQTKQMTVDIEKKGNQWVRDGVSREISGYRHGDGAYAAWKHRTASTWLTAFVAKVFCQAKKVVDDAVDKEEDIKITIDWLNDHVNADGSFIDAMPVIHREMIGQINEGDPTLTAFVLITLQECSIRSDKLNATIRKAMKYLESLPKRNLKNNPYLLAISTYALALSDSTKKNDFRKLLLGIQKKDREGSYWGNPGGKPASAHSVETTAYGLLAMLEFNDFRRSSSIVSWLISQRDGQGSFRTTQDTVVGLQALSQYSIATYSADVDLKVTLSADNWITEEIRVTEENAILQKVIPKLPVERGDNRLLVQVQGTGSAVMAIDLRYNRPATEEETCPFSVTDIDVQDVEDAPIDKRLADARNCDICGKCEGGDVNQYDDYDIDNFGNQPEIDPKMESNFGRKKRAANRRVRATATKKCIRFSVSSKNKKKYGMSIVKFGLETGVEVIKSDLDKLIAENNTNIARYEMPSDGKGFIVFYLHEITSSETNFIFRLKDGFDGEKNSRQPSSVYVYDYYNPDRHCTQFYGTGLNRGKSVSYQCGKDKKECMCFQSMCVQPVEEEIKKLAKKKKKKALKLYKYACNTDKANYAVVVTIDEVSYNPAVQEKNARGVVVTSINKGIEDLNEEDEIAFFWKFSCPYPELEEGKTYLIIGRDGNKFRLGEEEKYRYPLMGTALVIENITPQQARQNRKKYKLLHTVLTNFKRLMLGNGCQN
uniref:Complement component C3 n=1 Tax=Ruditapes decussatus TaxID=104385 RepID=C0JPJ2_9BIVA|nr:complement component C3 [Ruditapes decussatus]